MLQMNSCPSEGREAGHYPEHPGERECSYYVRTGLCRYGMTCRYNHPSNRKLAVAASRIKGGYPERIGQPECQYYLKTGICNFGSTCKFHHPRDKAAIAGRVQLNILGYPLQPGKEECAYYLRTLQCKFGNACKFHHPQPSNMMVSLRGSAVYPSVHSPTTAIHQLHPRLLNWPLTRVPLIPSPRWQDPSSYAQLILPQGVVPFTGWNKYPGQLGSVSSSDNHLQTLGTSQTYGTSNQSESTNATTGRKFFLSGSDPMGLYALQRENVFPERPDQPECQFYMKTGDCKFGVMCKFHHPRERLVSIPSYMLSPWGLPLRPGEPFCNFYSRYGACKFGLNCKYDHPMGVSYGFSVSSSTDVPVWHLFGSSSRIAAMSLSSEGPDESNLGKSRHPSLSETKQFPSNDENIKAEG